MLYQYKKIIILLLTLSIKITPSERIKPLSLENCYQDFVTDGQNPFVEGIIINILNNILIESSNTEFIDIIAPNWLFLCIRKCKQINTYWYKKINHYYTAQLREMRTNLNEENFQQLLNNYAKKIFPNLSRKQAKKTRPVNPWNIHDFCYDLIMYEQSNSTALLKFLTNSIENTSYCQYTHTQPFFKKIIENIIHHNNAPLVLILNARSEDNVKNKLKNLNIEFYDIFKDTPVHGWVDYKCLIYTQELKTIKDAYEKTISCFSHLLRNKEEYISEQLFSCVQKFLLLDKKSYYSLHDGYWKYITYHNMRTRFVFNTDFFCTIANPSFYNRDEIVCTNNSKAILSTSMHITLLKKIVDIKNKIEDAEHAKIIFSFDQPLFINKTTNDFFLKKGLLLQNYIEQENNITRYKYVISSFYYEDTKRNGTYSAEKMSEKNIELERKNFTLTFASQNEQHKKELTELRTNYEQKLRCAENEKQNLEIEIKKQEESIIDCEKVNADLTDQITSLKDNLEPELISLKSTIHKLEKDITEAQEKKLEYIKEKSALNAAILTLENEKKLQQEANLKSDNENKTLILTNQTLKNEMETLQSNNAALKNQLKNVKCIVTFGTMTIILSLLLYTIFQHKNSIYYL